MAHVRTSLDGRDTDKEGEHVAFLEASVGLEGLEDDLHVFEHYNVWSPSQ